jgi:hypothetical protein
MNDRPTCGYDLDPLDPRTGRPARVWYHRRCKRRVKVDGERCWQHR